jgi:hypothetical protein
MIQEAGDRQVQEEGSRTVNAQRAFVAGVVGALAMSLIMVLLRAIGIPLHIESQLAAALGSRLWGVGLAAHILIGGVLGLAYAIVFELAFNQAGVGPGVLLGACNTIFAGFVWAALGGPGSFWHELGASGIAALFLVHITYGAIVGGLYRTQHTLVYQ